MLPKARLFTVGPFTFSRLEGLKHRKRPVHLRHVERQLLKCLLDRAGEIVRKEEIFAALWPQTHVSANTLNVHVRRLRITLKDTKRPYRILRAVPRIGFMVIASPRPKYLAPVAGIILDACDKSRFVRDVTLPDGAIVEPGESFEKVWEIQNIGSVPWKGRALRRIGTSSGPGRLIGEPETPIPDTAPGRMCLIRLWLTAPSQPGSYYAAWKMVDQNGIESFPERGPLFVAVDVIDDGLWLADVGPSMP